MSKVIVELGYNKYLLDTKEAVDLVEILSKAEVYKEVWHKEEDGGTTYHVYEQDRVKSSMSIMPDHLCRMARLAGKPLEK
jgi:hypothetical protein